MTTTSKSVIRFTWDDGESDGGETIIDYRVTYDQSTSNFVMLADGITERSYTTSVTLISGRTYVFKVEARNSVGYSAYTAEKSLLAAQVPGQPPTPSTSISDNDVMITWTVTDDGSAQIVGYLVKIRQYDGVTFTEDSINCDGTNNAIILAQTCLVPISRLRANPFNIEWGGSIYVKITAYNLIGSSPESLEGNGAVILATPDPPIDFTNDVGVTSATQIGLRWSEASENGGTPVLDYRLSMYNTDLAAYEVV